MSYIQFHSVVKDYRQGNGVFRALDDATFDVEQGEVVALLGSSGSGKTTALNLLGGLDQPSGGSIRVGQTDVSALSRRELTAFRKSEVGFVFQLYNLVEGLTVYENVNVVSGLVSDPADAAELLEAVGLSELSRQFPAQLSGGQMQRVAIARALCKNPDLILCDEPTGALDSSAGKDVLRLLVRMSRAERKTVLVVTHNPAIALVADRVVRLHDGKVASVELVESPQSVEDVEL